MLIRQVALKLTANKNSYCFAERVLRYLPSLSFLKINKEALNVYATENAITVVRTLLE